MAKKFTPNTGTKVTKKEAMVWIDRYDKEMRKDKKKDTKSVFFGRDALLKMLSEEGEFINNFFLALKYNEIFMKGNGSFSIGSFKGNGELIWLEDTRSTKNCLRPFSYV